MSRRFLAYAGLYGGSAAALKLTGVALFFWLARVLSISEYASFGLLYALQQGLATFALAGIVEAVVGLLREHQTPGQLARLFSGANVVFLAMTLGAVMFALLVWTAFFKNTDIRFQTYAAVVVTGILLAFSSFQAQLTRLEEKHAASVLFAFVPPFLGFVGGLIGFVLGKTLAAFFAGSAASLVASLVILRLNRVGAWTVALGIEPRAILRRALPFIVVAFLGWLSGYGNNYLITLFFAPIEVAKFTVALSVSSIMLLIAGAVNQVWAPRFYRLIQEEPFEEVERKNGDFHRALGVVLSVVGGFILIIFPPTMRLLGGNLVAYQSMGVQLSLLIAAYVLLTPWWHCQYHFLSNGMGQAFLHTTLATSVVGIGALLLFIRVLGPIGIYVGFLSQMALRALGFVLVARRTWPVHVPWSGVAIGLVVILVGLLLSSSGLGLATSVLGYGAVVAALVAAFMREDWRWLVKTMRAGQAA